MGYHTDFNGSFKLNKPLTEAQIKYLRKFAETRRMVRDVTILERLCGDETKSSLLQVSLNLIEEYKQDNEYPTMLDQVTKDLVTAIGKTGRLIDPCRKEVGLPLGEGGIYFVGGTGYMGQDVDESVIETYSQSSILPGAWCQWMPNDAGTEIEWDGGEKFYNYVEWLEFIIEHFLKVWGYVLNGEVNWDGEENDDNGIIYVQDNKVEAVANTSMNSGPSWDKVKT